MRPRREGALLAEVEFTAIQCGVHSCVYFRVLVHVCDRELVSAAAGLPLSAPCDCICTGISWSAWDSTGAHIPGAPAQPASAAVHTASESVGSPQGLSTGASGFKVAQSEFRVEEESNCQFKSLQSYPETATE